MKKIYCGLLILSSYALISAPFSQGWLQATLISFSINIITSIIIIIFVDKALEKQSQKIRIDEEKKLERQSILNAHRIIECLLPIYIFEFNQLTLPVERRVKDHRFCDIDCQKFNEFYKMSDLRDMFSSDITVYGRLNDSILETFDMIDKKFANAFESMLTKCSFKHYTSVENAINEIIRTSLQPNAISTLNFLRNDKKVVTMLTQMMKEYNGNPDEDIEKYSGNLFINPLILYNYLKQMKNAVEKYCDTIKLVAEEENYEI